MSIADPVSPPDAPCATIAYAIVQSASGDIIQLQSGIYTEVVSIDRNLQIRGNGMANTVLQAHPAPQVADSRVVSIGSSIEVELRDATVRHGRIQNGNGGGIANAGTLDLLRVRVTHNRAEGTLPRGFTLSTGLGGGIYGATGSMLRMVDSEIIDNSTNVAGGGIGLFGNAEISNTLISNNTTFLIGGGIASIPIYGDGDNEVWISGSTLNGNEAMGGGGLGHPGGRLELDDVDFIDNDATETGGGMASAVGDLFALNVRFVNNFSGGIPQARGGALSMTASSPDIIWQLDNIEFRDNETDGDGGAIHISSNPDIGKPLARLSEVAFQGNRAAGHGGALYADQAEIEISGGCAFTSNHAGQDGGAIFNGSLFNPAGSTELSLIGGCVLIDNHADGRGGALFHQAGMFVANGGQISNNTADGHGGGVYNEADMNLSGLTLSDNVTNEDGGGIFNIQNAILTLDQVTVSGNHAFRGGAAFATAGHWTLRRVWSKKIRRWAPPAAAF